MFQALEANARINCVVEAITEAQVRMRKIFAKCSCHSTVDDDDDDDDDDCQFV